MKIDKNNKILYVALREYQLIINVIKYSMAKTAICFVYTNKLK